MKQSYSELSAQPNTVASNQIRSNPTDRVEVGLIMAIYCCSTLGLFYAVLHGGFLQIWVISHWRKWLIEYKIVPFFYIDAVRYRKQTDLCFNGTRWELVWHLRKVDWLLEVLLEVHLEVLWKDWKHFASRFVKDVRTLALTFTMIWITDSVNITN